MYEIFEELLNKRGVTAYRVAKETGIANTTLTQWKKGQSTPKTEKLQKIADYFDVPLEYLIYGKVTPETNLTLEVHSLRRQLEEYERLDSNSKIVIDRIKKKQLNPQNVSRLINYMDKMIAIQNDEDYLKVQAAHMKKNATQYEIEHDNDIMKDDSNWE